MPTFSVFGLSQWIFVRMFIHQSNFWVKSRLQAKFEVIQRTFNYLTRALNIWGQRDHPQISDFQKCADVLPCSSRTAWPRAKIQSPAESSLHKEKNKPPTAAVSLTHVELYPIMLAWTQSEGPTQRDKKLNSSHNNGQNWTVEVYAGSWWP